jgi:hypothetical protein
MAIRRAGFALLLLGLNGAAQASDPMLGQAEIERRAEAAARYLVATETAEGRFFYEFDFLRSHFTADDNIVRQAGAGFILNQFYFLSGKPGFAEPAARSIAYYESESVAVDDGLLLSEDETPAGARAGGTALALLAELFHSRAIGTDFRPDLRQGWFRGLAAQQLPEGGIAQVPGQTTADSYATGETWLALAHYVDLVPAAAEVAATLERIETGIMARYLAAPDRMFAHWGMMAAAQRLATTGEARYRDFPRTVRRQLCRGAHACRRQWHQHLRGAGGSDRRGSGARAAWRCRSRGNAAGAHRDGPAAQPQAAIVRRQHAAGVRARPVLRGSQAEKPCRRLPQRRLFAAYTGGLDAALPVSTAALSTDDRGHGRLDVVNVISVLLCCRDSGEVL